MDCLSNLMNEVGDPRVGLPERVFQFVSQVTPMINVDLLITDPVKGTLLTWREDQFYGPGWHVPGGIIRFKELAETRIDKVARIELGATVHYSKGPIAVNEIMATHRNVRGHFISMLYNCRMTSILALDREFKVGQPRNGCWKWHSVCPEDLIPVQNIYREYIGSSNKPEK